MKKYTKDKITMYCADNMQMMRDMKDNEFELAIVDPPYGLGKRTTDGGSKKNTQTKFMDDIRRSNWDDVIPTDNYFEELFRVSKKQIIWGGNYFPYIWKNGCRGLITWDKMVHIPTMSQIEYAWFSDDKLPKLVKINNNNSNRIHPTQKPVALYKWLLLNYAKKGDKILDTHGGSFSSAIACWQLGFEYVGIEIDEEYFDNGVKRLKMTNQPILPDVFSI